MKLTLIAIAVLVLSACASMPPISMPAAYTSYDCQTLFSTSQNAETEAQLDLTSDLFRKSCHREVIHLASYIRGQRRDKLYSLSGEAGELLTPEGTFTPYTLESYERSFLSLLISLSYMHLGQEDSALAELRRSRNEEDALIYNHGNDSVLALLQAALWDRFDSNSARPLWKAVSESSNQDPMVQQFATRRISEIDANPNRLTPWRIYGYGEMPELKWHTTLNFKKGPYTIEPASAFPATCSSKKSLLVATDSWVTKIGTKYNADYHPLMFAKSFVRLPVGLAYGLVGISSGVAVGVGGCALASYAKESGAELCLSSMEAAGYLIGKSADLVTYTLAPDLRRWKKLPMAFLITNDVEMSEEGQSCIAATSAQNFARTVFAE